jgi:hypothetical protein
MVAIAADDRPAVRFQVAELPDIKATITEYQGHARTCACCGHITQATIPEDIRRHSIGPGLSALMSYLVGNCGLSKRRVEELVEAVFEVPISLGTVIHLEQELSAALESTHAEALDAVRSACLATISFPGWRRLEVPVGEGVASGFWLWF